MTFPKTKHCTNYISPVYITVLQGGRHIFPDRVFTSLLRCQFRQDILQQMILYRIQLPYRQMFQVLSPLDGCLSLRYIQPWKAMILDKKHASYLPCVNLAWIATMHFFKNSGTIGLPFLLPYLTARHRCIY